MFRGNKRLVGNTLNIKKIIKKYYCFNILIIN